MSDEGILSRFVPLSPASRSDKFLEVTDDDEWSFDTDVEDIWRVAEHLVDYLLPTPHMSNSLFQGNFW